MRDGVGKDMVEPALAPKTEVSPAGIAVIVQLLERLHMADLTYCHWKSNEHLGPALQGLTDLDVLVDPRQHLELKRVLADSGFKRFAATAGKAYPAVEDYLGFDVTTGRLAHLHLHYRLTVGQPHLKGYRLPWETEVLSRRSLDQDHGMFVADPAIELLLLLVRGVLKRRLRDSLRSAIRRSSASRPSGERREFDWLCERTDPDAVCEAARALLGPDTEAQIRTLLAAPDDPRARRQFKRAARPVLDRYRTYGPISATIRASFRELQWIVDAINRRMFHRPTPLRRTSPRGGVVIVILGSDGSGKSSLLKEMVAWLGVKLDVIPIYFGSGDGPGSLYRLPLQGLRRAAEAGISLFRPAPTGSSQRSGPTPRSPLRAAGLLPWALTLSLEKRSKLRRMIRARNRGMIVVCDRFPQADCPGFNDGPLLHHLRDSRWRVCRILSAWEEVPYREAGLDPPDLVIKLFASPEVVAGRRPEMTLADIQRRIDAVRGLSFPGSSTIVEVPTNGPIDQSALAIKRIVWSQL